MVDLASSCPVRRVWMCCFLQLNVKTPSLIMLAGCDQMGASRSIKRKMSDPLTCLSILCFWPGGPRSHYVGSQRRQCFSQISRGDPPPTRGRVCHLPHGAPAIEAAHPAPAAGTSVIWGGGLIKTAGWQFHLPGLHHMGRCFSTGKQKEARNTKTK